MDNFIVSARKYRPATFDTVVGQAPITNTLKNAIRNNHLAQAFLFCGPRGVGKTTCARILAKTINCFNITSATEACDTCESCRSFNEGHSLNVYELDAASNNSVEDIRNLVDQVRFAPQLGSHKVYIIDEVHMLSQAAFNAFLKTLEEPPRHAIFILATTERHKIIPTILSRCQIFDFSRIQVEDIAKHLGSIAQKEGITAEPEALHIIAQKADGALRDALSIFDQMVSFSGNTITYKAVIENLNILDYDYYFKVTDAVLEENIPAALLIFNEILSHGFDGHHFITGLSEHMRNLLVCKDESTLQLLEVSGSIRERYKQQSAKPPMALLLGALNVLSRCDTAYRASKNQRLQVELALMQLCSLQTGVGEKKNEQPVIKPAQSAEQTVQQPVQQSVQEKPVQQAVASKEIPKVAATGKTVIKTGAASISQFTKKAEVKETPEEKESAPEINKELPKKTFTADALNEAWSRFAGQMESEGKNRLSTSLKGSKPVLKDSFAVEFTLDNKAQLEMIEEAKGDLLGFLRQALQNFSISLVTVVSKTENSNKPYTASDKYSYMAKKNPSLDKLKQQFDLEIEM